MARKVNEVGNDAKVAGLLEGRYRTGAPLVADSLGALLEKLPLDRSVAVRTLDEYDAAVGAGAFDPTARDRLGTTGLVPPKSNWAQRLDAPPFVAYPVTSGITFTFGGVRVNERAQVMSTSWAPIPGLYVCGEMVGGFFHTNYPGGTRLMSGASSAASPAPTPPASNRRPAADRRMAGTRAGHRPFSGPLAGTARRAGATVARAKPVRRSGRRSTMLSAPSTNPMTRNVKIRKRTAPIG